MAKVSDEAKRKYSDKIKVYKKMVEDQIQKEKQILQILKNDETGSGLRN